MIHAMHCFMSRIITFTMESAEKAVATLRRPQLFPFAQVLTSTSLNLQVKQAMQSLLREITSEVLAELEKAMLGHKTKAQWAEVFCVLLVLCICIEAVQVTSDSYAIAALRKFPECGLSRSAICQKLDEKPFKDLTGLFHIIYKTYKTKDNQTSKVGFNPIRYGLKVSQDKGTTQQMVDFVSEIKEIMTTHGKFPLLFHSSAKFLFRR
jgi:hypothetical protein